MRRILFTIAAAISMLLCIAIAALWVRSYFVADVIARKVDAAFDLPELHLTTAGNDSGAFVFVDELISQGDRNSQYIALIPITWTWQKSHADRSYPAVTLATVSSMAGTARRQFSFRVLRTEISYRNQIPDAQGIYERNWVVVIPHALVVGLTGALPALWIFKWRRRRAVLDHLQPCPACGYSLVGNTSGFCPECGLKITSATL